MIDGQFEQDKKVDEQYEKEERRFDVLQAAFFILSAIVALGLLFLALFCGGATL